MAVFTTSFSIPGNYTYDSNKIEVSGGVAAVRENLTDIYGRWHLNESTGGIASDSSGNGRDGILLNMENSDWVAAKLNNGLLFDGSNESVNLGDIANFEYNVPFSCECWFNTLGGSAHVFMSRMETIGTSRGWMLYIQTGLIKFLVRSSGTPDRQAWVQTINTFNDGNWHHLVATYNGSGITAGMHVYVDNVDQTLGIVAETLGTNTTLNSGDCSIGSRNNTNLYFVGTLDEVVLYSRTLTVPEVSFRYNAGIGREDVFKYSDKPTIYKTAGDSGTINSFSNFVITDGVTEGSKGYQLSEDGITWEYWNGSSWTTAGANDYNAAAVVNTNIATFSAASNAIYVKTFLISDGLQREEIDEIQITYAENADPTVDAGTNKTVKSNAYAQPFSDGTFSDLDGTIDHVYYRINGEIDVWTEILQGGYSSLLEAVQSFSYQFVNLGVITARLQVEDNFGALADDSLLVTVEKYTKTVNVKDVVTGDHIINFDFNPGDGSGTAQQDSPFLWDWAYGNFDITVEKFFFYVKEQTILVEDESELNVFIQSSSFLNQCVASVGLMTEGDKLAITTWLQQGGELIDNPTSCTITLYDQNDVEQYVDTSSSPSADGHFSFSRSPSELENEGVYHLDVEITAGGVDFKSTIPIGLLERKLISFEGSVHIDINNGTSGTNFPQGTPNFPVNNFANAKTIADSNNLKSFFAVGDVAIVGTDISKYTIRGRSAHVASVTLSGGCTTLATSFEDIDINGELNGAAHIHHCHINNVTGLEGHIHLATLVGPIVLGEEVILNDSGCGKTGGNFVEVDLNGKVLEVHNFFGDIKILGKTDSGTSQLDMGSGEVTIDSSCIAGTIIIRGICDVIDNSSPSCTIIKTAAITNRTIWAELLVNSTITGSFGKLLQDINIIIAGIDPLITDLHDEALGKWVLDENSDPMTLTIYRKDNATILVKFNLGITSKNVQPIISRNPV